MEKRSNAGFRIYLFIMMVFLGAMLWMSYLSGAAAQSTMERFYEEWEEGNVVQVVIRQNQEIPTGRLEAELKNGRDLVVNVSDVTALEAELQDRAITYRLADVERESYFFRVLLPVLLIILALFLMLLVINHSMAAGAGGGNRMSDFGKSRAQLIRDGDRQATFQDVAGLDEEKEDLSEVVDFLKNPKKYNELGARIPKGVLLVGPPGTGKTLLAKAVAGEAKVPFFSISGSDFVEMYVGVGASRVRDLFHQAKANAPCIVFIDEIDAVARRRGSGMGCGHDEREQTLNQMLVEMDGFTTNQGIIVMAATNRVDILDPAILRPGRFDRKVQIGRPDVKGREAILKVHAKKKPLADNVDLERIARVTTGYTGAKLESLLNEAAIAAAKANRKYITNQDIEESFIKISIGTEKRSRLVSEEERRITAYHETGHAILFHVLPHVGPVHTISIVPTGSDAAGYTMPLPEKDTMFMTKGKLLEEICVSLGGRIAEEMIFDDITTGASQDIKQATEIARTMVTQYGMSEKLGLVNYGSDDDEVFIGRDYGHVRNHSEQVAGRIDEEVKRIVDECYARAYELIRNHETVLHKCAERLLENEKVLSEEFEALFAECQA